MKKNAFFTLFLAFMSIFSAATAQDAKGMEIGLRMQPSAFSVKNTELVWKRQINDRKWQRLRVGDFDAGLFSQQSPKKANFDISYGREKRWKVWENDKGTKQFALVTGRELTLGSRYVAETKINSSKRNIQNSSLYIGGNAVLGMHYAFSRRFALNAEITPGIDIESAPYMKANDVLDRKTNLNLHIWNPRLTIVYRLRK